MQSTKVAALLKPSTQHMHRKMEERIVELLQSPVYMEGLTRYDIAELLHKGVNCVTAPVRALLDAGVLKEHERIKQPQTGVHAWTLKLVGSKYD